MKTVEIECKQFNEWSEDIQKIILDKQRDINLDYGWWESIYEDAARIGLEITGFDIDRNRDCKGEFILSASEVAANILKNHEESCETYRTAESFLNDWQPVFAEYTDEQNENYESSDSEFEMTDLEEGFLKSLLEDYSIILQHDYEWRYSDDAVAETLIENSYEFDSTGKIW